MAFAMLVLAMAMSSSSFSILRASTRQVVGERVQAAADAGLEMGLLQLSSSPSYTGTQSSILLAEGPETYRVITLRSPANLPNGNPVPSGCVYVTGVGERPGAASATSSALVRLGSGGAVVGLDGIFADAITLIGASKVDSYNSDTGTVLFPGSNGTVRTNSSDPGSIRLLGASSVFGPVTVGTTGKVESGGLLSYTVGTGYTIWRDWVCTVASSVKASVGKDYPSVVLPSNPNNTSVSYGYGALTVNPGVLGSVSVGGSAFLTLSGGDYVLDSLTINGAARITISGTTPVRLYIKNKMDVSGAVILNQSKQPDMLQIYMADGSTYNQSGGTSVAAALYAPNSTVNLNGGSQICGAVLGQNVTVAGASVVHYDETMANLALSPGGLSTGSGSVLFRQRI